MTRTLHRIIGLLTVVIILLSGKSLIAQTATFSPYSRYGIGELLYNGYGWQRAMGGIASGTYTAAHLNFGNPASYVADSVTIFEIGINGEALNIANSSISENKLNGNISYLGMGFPLVKGKAYLSIGMLPLSATGYNIKQVNTGTAATDPQFYFQGDGGYNRYFAGVGFKISQSLWAGVNASYLYGTTNRTSRVEFSESTYLSTKIINSLTLSDYYLDGGLIYNKKLKNGRLFTAGLTVSPEMNINGKRDELWVNYFLRSGNIELRRDTVSFVEKEKGSVKFPIQAGIGFTVSEGQKWLIGFDARFQQWENLEIYGVNAGLNNSLRIATGMQITPDIKSLKYANRITYRFGGFYSSPKLTDFTSMLGGVYLIGKLFDKAALEVKNSDINEAGVTFGFGFPLRGKPYFSDLDISVELSERGTVKQNLVRERYVRLVLGLTLREEWFHKTQFD
ncbi:MAG: hypothetical protein ABI772_08930 [Bacteroidota bacterium]